MDTCAVTFLFKFADGARSFDEAFLCALSGADPMGLTHTMVGRGDALVAELCTKVTAVSGGLRNSGHRQSYDTELYQTLIWDLVDALAGQWNTLDMESFPDQLGRRGVHCIATPTLPRRLREAVDAGLRGARGYLGAIEVDLGSPLQRKAFIEFLIKDTIIVGGQVVQETGFEGEKESWFDGADTFRPGGCRWVAYGELRSQYPPLPIPDWPSPRGQLSIDRYEKKRRFSLQERVLAGLIRSDRRERDGGPFAIATHEQPHAPLEAELPEAKFVQYLLDPLHEFGGPKARFFADVLGIEAKDWRYLAAQFHDGLRSAELVELGIKTFEGGFGVKFNAVMRIKGLNGQTAVVDTNWIMKPGLQPSLVTATPGRAAEAAADAQAPPLVDPSLAGDARWAGIHMLAASAAAQARDGVVPTPLKVDGLPVQMDGLCGFAWVKLGDGRRGFARWARRAGEASRAYRGGAHIFFSDDSQSVDRAEAKARAYAAVLAHNGVLCEVERVLD